jgi:hypothetical protein
LAYADAILDKCLTLPSIKKEAITAINSEFNKTLFDPKIEINNRRFKLKALIETLQIEHEKTTEEKKQGNKH